MNILPVSLIIAFVCSLFLHAQTSETVPKLADVLKRYPKADTDKDGILTLAEAIAYRDKHLGKKSGSPALAPEGGTRHIYKTVGGTELPLYVFPPEGHKPTAKAPAIVFFFGGGWVTGNPNQFEKQCKHLASRGMVAITVEYRVKSRHDVELPDCIQDAKSAMRWVRANAEELGIDPERIASAGGSAGGHLAACTSLIDDHNDDRDNKSISAKPNAMVLFNPALAISPDERMSESNINKLKKRATTTDLPLKKLSPLTYASSKQPPCIMFFGTEDPLLEGAELYKTDSKAAGNECKVVTYEGQKHSFFNRGKHFELTLAATDKFLVDLGWLEKAGS